MNKQLNIEMVKILTQPVVPVVLHGINPRKIMSAYKWKKLGSEWREKAQNCCMICEKYVSHSPGDYLELHEQYDYDFEKLIQKHTGYVSICGDCHHYIHIGRLKMLVGEGRMTKEKFAEIKAKGDKLLAQFGLEKIQVSRDVLYDDNWQLEFEGKLYGKE